MPLMVDPKLAAPLSTFSGDFKCMTFQPQDTEHFISSRVRGGEWGWGGVGVWEAVVVKFYSELEGSAKC